MGNVSGPYHYITNPSGTGDVVSNKVSYSPWSPTAFICAGTNGSLPLVLSDFQVSNSAAVVRCSWQTSSESNTSHFIIQRSTQGVDFANIGRVNATGNSVNTVGYAFTDQTPGSGINYYRLQMVDKDGSYTYSKVLAININSTSSFTVFPNPVKENMFVQLQNRISGEVTLQIVDMQGKILQRQTQLMQTGTTTVSFNTSRLAKGVYILKILGEKTDQKTFVKE